LWRLLIFLGVEANSMKKFWTVAVLSAALTSLSQVAANAATVSFTSTLNGAQENPPVNTSAMGTATGTLSSGPDGDVFIYTLSYSGLTSSLTDGHIHIGERGTNGPILHQLDNLSTFLGTTSGTITGDWRFDDLPNPSIPTTSRLTDDFAEALSEGELYFNLHTSNFPGGEIRGQIEEVPEPSSALGVLALSALGVSLQLRNQKNKH
jgi:hypothetical protein